MRVEVDYDILGQRYRMFATRDDGHSLEGLTPEGHWVAVPQGGHVPWFFEITKRRGAHDFMNALALGLEAAGFRAPNPEPKGALQATERHLSHLTLILDKNFSMQEKLLAKIEGPVTINNSSR